jgi:hypothetical protein
MAAGKATLVLLFSALLFAYSISSPGLDDVLAWPVIFLGSLAASLLYGLAWGWKGLAMCIAIAFTYTAAGFVGIMFRHPQPGAGFAAGLAGVGVVLAGGISLFLSLIGGVVGAVLHRRHKRPR